MVSAFYRHAAARHVTAAALPGPFLRIYSGRTRHNCCIFAAVLTAGDCCLTFCSTLDSVADTITFRPDEDASRALVVLTRDGTPVSVAVRAALIEAARRKAAAAVRAEAEELAADEADRAEAMQVLRDMETLRAW